MKTWIGQNVKCVLLLKTCRIINKDWGILTTFVLLQRFVI